MPTRTQTPNPRPAISSPLRRVKDKTGRVDWAAAMVLERHVERMGNPVLSALYAGFAPELEAALSRYLGPRNRRMGKLRKMIRAGVEAKAKREWTGVRKAEEVRP